MNRPRAKEGKPYVPPKNSSDDEITNSVVEEEFDQFTSSITESRIAKPLIALVLIVACVITGLIAASFFI